MSTFLTKRIFATGLLLTVLSLIPSFNSSYANEILPSGLEMNTISFSQSGEILEYFQEPFLKVFINNQEESLDIVIKLKLYEEQDDSKYSLIHTPSGQSTMLSSEEKDQLVGSLSIENLHRGQNTLSVKRFSSEDKEYSPYFLPFIIEDSQNKPSSRKIIWDILQKKEVLILLFILFISILLFWRRRKEMIKVVKIMLFILLIAESLFLSLVFSQDFLRISYTSGLLVNSSFNTTISQNTLFSSEVETLTKLDQNGSLKASLAKSWSNISPLVWQFKISKELKTSELVQDLQEKSQIASISQLLSSVSEIISTPNQEIQFLMKSPDPLLAHKLTQVPIKRASKNDLSKEIRKSSSHSITYDKNQHVKLEETQSSIEQQKEKAKSKTVDTFIEPNPGLWPILFQKEYRIIPVVNSVSISLLANRNHKTFASTSSLVKLRNRLQSGAVLQTSYFQYGQLASQFASPGVTGYDPNLSIPTEFQEREHEHSEDDEASQFIFRYPNSEKSLAKVIEQELQNMAFDFTMISYDGNTLQKILLEEETDLLLLEHDFILGDLGPFLDSFVDSNSLFNKFYKNEKVDALIAASRKELNQYERLRMLQEIMNIIVLEDPIGIPLLYRRSFLAEKKGEETSLLDSLMRWILDF